MAISMLKIRRPLGRLIFNMGIAIPGRTVFLIETAPWSVEVWLFLSQINIIIMKSYDCLVVSNLWQLNCLLNNLLKICITAICVVNPLVINGFPSQRASNVESDSMSWCLHNVWRIQHWHVLKLDMMFPNQFSMLLFTYVNMVYTQTSLHW